MYAVWTDLTTLGLFNTILASKLFVTTEPLARLVQRNRSGGSLLVQVTIVINRINTLGYNDTVL